MEAFENSQSDYWKRFESSGLVDDYLRYAQCGTQGESNAGICNSNGNYTKADAYR